MRILRICLAVALLTATGSPSALATRPDGAPLDAMEAAFRDPPAEVQPFVWWHWMGSNFTKEGITRDLEAMKASGIGGATIFNLTSAVQESHAPTGNLPFPSHTYRSAAYWEALRHAAAEADRLGLEIGLHNTVGYSTTGGPWVDETRSMQRLVWSEARVDGGASSTATLPVPPIPAFKGWGETGRTLTEFRDIAVLAVPADRPVIDAADVVDLTSRMSAPGALRWDAPPGRWVVYRIGHASTGASPHPVPDELIGKTLEVDKMSAANTAFHWNTVLEPLVEHLGPLVGRSVRHVLIDSYEAGLQNWSPGFRETFRQLKGYDPLPWLVTMGSTVTLDQRTTPLRIVGSAAMTARFEWDYRDVIARLFRERGWEPARQMIHARGMALQFEPYGGPFDTVAGAGLADLPMVEFWTHLESTVAGDVVSAARAAGRTVVGAEAFTGRPESSMWSETPGALKRSADAAFAAGVNRMVLHHWVHQPFDDRYRPGMGMGWWGTHFGRNQTWAEPGREFYRYLGRVQALLQRGETPVDIVSVGTAVPDADTIPPHTFLNGLRVERGRTVLASGRSYAIVVVPHDGALLPEMVRRIAALLEEGATVAAARPDRSPSLTDYPRCDSEVRALAESLWDHAEENGRRVGRGQLFTDVRAASAALGLSPLVQVTRGDAAHVRVHARQDGPTSVFFVAQLGSRPARLTISFRVSGLLPELWDAEAGTIQPAPIWRTPGDRTEVDLAMGAEKSVFVVFRRRYDGTGDHLTSVEAPCGIRITADEAGRPAVTGPDTCRVAATFASGSRVTVATSPDVVVPIDGPWSVDLVAGAGRQARLELDRLTSLSEQAEPDVRYFSGTATYRTSLTLGTEAAAGRNRFVLDLGDVRDLVRVAVNGTDLGILWHPPFQREITAALKPGENELALAVTNTWHNRLVGDEHQPADVEWGPSRGKALGRPLRAYPDWFLADRPRPSTGRRTFATWSYHGPDTPLLPSGLIGPVRILRQEPRTLAPVK
jgi:hypothetical protein